MISKMMVMVVMILVKVMVVFIEMNDSNHGLPWWLRWWRICLQCGRPGFDPWVRKIPWRWEWLPTPVFLPREFHGQKRLVRHSPWDLKEWDVTKWLPLSLSHNVEEERKKKTCTYAYDWLYPSSWEIRPAVSRLECGHSFPLSRNRNQTSQGCKRSRGHRAVLLSHCSRCRIPDSDESSGLGNQLLKGRLCHKQKSLWESKNLDLERIKTSFRCYWLVAWCPSGPNQGSFKKVRCVGVPWRETLKKGKNGAHQTLCVAHARFAA